MLKATETNNNKTMQNYYKTIGALVVASAFAAGNASAEVESDLHVGFSNAYMFRGVKIGTDLVEAGLNVATEYNGLGISGGLWHGTFKDNNNESFTELDIYGAISKEFSFATLAVGVIHYDNERNFDVDYSEIYLSASRQFYGLDASLTIFGEIEGDTETYSEAKVGKSFELSPCLTLNTGATLGYLWEVREFSHLGFKASLDYAYSETATVSPFVSYDLPLTGNNDTVYDETDNEFNAGVMLSVSF
jgi:hypothetical protein